MARNKTIKMLRDHAPYVAGRSYTVSPHIAKALCDGDWAEYLTAAGGSREMGSPPSHRAMTEPPASRDLMGLREARDAEDHKALGHALARLGEDVPRTKADRIAKADELLGG